MRYDFVRSTMERLIREGMLSHESSVLVVAGSEEEKRLFHELEFGNVTISNLDERIDGSEFAPFTWSFQNAQRLNLADKSFDFSFVSDGLHHCDSPHQALLEMYRVARKGVIVFESRDSLLMRSAARLGLTPEYELEAVVGNSFTHGGVNNTHIPNFIYRWTEREFVKTIRSYDPIGVHHFRFFYGLNLPYSQAEMRKSRLKYITIVVLEPIIRLLTLAAKRQCNSFCMVALRPSGPEALWPWLAAGETGIVINREYAEALFKAQ